MVAVDYVRRHRCITSASRGRASSWRTMSSNECQPGDIVRIEETRPLSKNKRWIVREIIERGVQI